MSYELQVESFKFQVGVNQWFVNQQINQCYERENRNIGT